MNVAYLYKCTRLRNSFKIFHFRVDMHSDLYFSFLFIFLLFIMQKPVLISAELYKKLPFAYAITNAQISCVYAQADQHRCVSLSI